MRYDLIELFTDIDDDFIADAMPEDQRPVEMKADTRRFSWKSYAAAAACLAVIAVGGTFALKAVSGKGGLVSSENANSGTLNPAGSPVSEPTDSTVSEPTGVVLEPAKAGYPEDAMYQYKGDFSELELNNYALVDRIVYQSFDELVENSDLVVVGTFVDDAWQNRPTDNYSHLSSIGASYNKLRIDKVFCGDVEVGEEIVICDSYFVTKGELMYITTSTLTPMIKGEQWVYFLKKQSPEFGDYYQPLFTEGRYPVPGNENTFVLTGSLHGVFDERYFREDIYEDVKKMLGYVDGVEIVGENLSEDKITFTMPEFPGDEFIWTEDYISVCQKRIKYTHGVFTAPGITSLYLTDLNGDGKRELVTLRRDSDSGLIADNFLVCDYANSMYYTLNTDTTKICNDLELRDNVLYVLTYPTDSSEAISDEPLTFDMLKPITRSGLDNLDNLNNSNNSD